MTTRKLLAVSLLMVVFVLVAVAEEGSTWKDSVKEKAGNAADGAKSWKAWAVSKWRGNGEEKAETVTTSTTEKSGEMKENVMRMTSEELDKANEGAKMAGDQGKAAKDKAGAHEL